MRAYIEAVAALRDQKQTALKVVARYTRLKEAKPVEEIYGDAVKYVDQFPALNLKPYPPLWNSWAKRDCSSKLSPIIPSWIGWFAQDLSSRFTRSDKNFEVRIARSGFIRGALKAHQIRRKSLFVDAIDKSFLL